MAFWICVVLLPVISGVHRYAVCYGYQGMSKRVAWMKAKDAFSGTLLITGILAIVKVAGGQ